MTLTQLVVADYRADRTYAVDEGVVTPLGSGVLAEHAGALPLPARQGRGGEWAFVDDAHGALVVSGEHGERRIPVAIPGEHLACDASGRFVVITTGVGASAEAWSDVVTVVDLDRDSSVRFRARVGEPGAMLIPDQADGQPSVVLRHREPGAIEAFRLTDCLDVAPHVPRLTGQSNDDLGHDGHGDVADPRTGIVATATSRGLERFVIDNGIPRPIGIVCWPVAGRAYFLRFDPATGHALGVVRGGPSAATAWTEWTNHLVDIDLVSGDSRVVPVPPGLAFRFALGGDRIAVATIHPGGDKLTVIERSDEQLRMLREVPLPGMSHPPAAGHLPWDPIGDAPVQRRAVAVDPAGMVIAVTRGGDGQLHLISEAGFDTIPLPTPLHEGGHLYWHGSTTDAIGR